MKILLIDDHTSFCEGLVAAIAAKRPDIEIEFESDAEFVPAELLSGTQFDLLIIDVMMPGLGGLELVKHLNAIGNFTPVLIMSSIDDEETVQELFTLGVLGFIPKYYNVEAILDAIESCYRGEMHVPERFQNSVRLPQQTGERRQADRSTASQQSRAENTENQLSLTKRQLEILSLMDRGLTNQEMAQVLHISIATVKTHIHHLYNIFKVSNRVNCLRAAKRVKLR